MVRLFKYQLGRIMANGFGRCLCFSVITDYRYFIAVPHKVIIRPWNSRFDSGTIQSLEAAAYSLGPVSAIAWPVSLARQRADMNGYHRKPSF